MALHSQGTYEKSSASGFVLAEPLSGHGKEFSQNAVTLTHDRVNHEPYGGSTTPPFNTYESRRRSRESELFWCLAPQHWAYRVVAFESPGIEALEGRNRRCHIKARSSLASGEGNGDTWIRTRDLGLMNPSL